MAGFEFCFVGFTVTPSSTVPVGVPTSAAIAGSRTALLSHALVLGLTGSWNEPTGVCSTGANNYGHGAAEAGTRLGLPHFKRNTRTVWRIARAAAPLAGRSCLIDVGSMALSRVYERPQGARGVRTTFTRSACGAYVCNNHPHNGCNVTILFLVATRSWMDERAQL